MSKEENITRPQSENDVNSSQKQEKNDKTVQYDCRICLSKVKQSELLDVCECKGSSKAIHKQCLIEWIRNSEKYYSKSSGLYFDCDLCKYPMALQQELQVAFCEYKHQCTKKYVVLNILMVFLVVISVSIIVIPKLVIKNPDLMVIPDSLVPIGIVALSIGLLSYAIYYIVTIKKKIVRVKIYKLQQLNLNPQTKKREKNSESAHQIYTDIHQVQQNLSQFN